MVKQGVYIYAWPSVYNADLRKFFDKLTVKPKQQRKCSSGDGIRLITVSLQIGPAKAGKYLLNFGTFGAYA